MDIKGLMKIDIAFIIYTFSFNTINEYIYIYIYIYIYVYNIINAYTNDITFGAVVCHNLVYQFMSWLARRSWWAENEIQTSDEWKSVVFVPASNYGRTRLK